MNLDPEPDHSAEISDADFDRMVKEAEALAASDLKTYRAAKRRFGLIRTFQIPLSEVTPAELYEHFSYVVRLAKPLPPAGSAPDTERQ